MTGLSIHVTHQASGTLNQRCQYFRAYIQPFLQFAERPPLKPLQTIDAPGLGDPLK